MVARDGLSFDEAVGTLQTNHRVQLTRSELHDILMQLPARAVRRPAGEEELELIASRGGALDPAFDEPDDLLLVRRIEAALAHALDTLPARDRLLLKMRYLDGLPAPAIARVLEIEAKPLYRRLEQILRLLRAELHRTGITQTDIDRIVGHPAATLGHVLREPAGLDRDAPTARPSNG
jgi:RNA polymerase sigma factor (sigma-70 family)